MTLSHSATSILCIPIYHRIYLRGVITAQSFDVPQVTADIHVCQATQKHTEPLRIAAL